MVTTSILIASWNTKEITRECLTSLSSFANRSEVEVVVVDNGSTDNSAEMISSEFGWVKLIKNDKNVGYAPAVNQAFSISSGKYVFLIGSDVLVPETTFNTLVRFLDEHPGYGGVSPKLENPPDNRLQKSLHRFPTLMDGIFTYLSLSRFCGKYHYQDYDYTKNIDVDQPDATAVLFRREIFSSDGYIFDESFKILYTDVEMCKRINSANQKIRFIIDVSVLHYGSLSCKRATPAVRLQMYKDIFRYYQREFGVRAYLLKCILFFRLAAAADLTTAFKFIAKS